MQSSTESAQDGYLDNLERKSQTNGSSSDSSLTKGSRNHLPALGPREPQVPAAVVLSPDSSRELQNEQVKLGGAADEPRTEPLPRRKLSSIGIQVGASFRRKVLIYGLFDDCKRVRGLKHRLVLYPFFSNCAALMKTLTSITGYLMLFKKVFLHVVFTLLLIVITT